MNENLPPPYWSPTGNSGTWDWDESKPIGCWKWTDDGQPNPPIEKQFASKKTGKWTIVNKLKFLLNS